MKKVRPGQPLEVPAGTFNTFIDTAQAHLDRTRGKGEGQLPGGVWSNSDSGRILVRNDSGALVDRFGILGVDDIVIAESDNSDQFKSSPALSVITPAVPDHSENFVVLAEPLRHEAEVADRPIGVAVIDGVTVAQVDVQDADHNFAVVVAGQTTKFASAADGAVKIVYKESGTGDKWAVVRLGGRPFEAAGPMELEKWFDIVGPTDGWETFDTRSWMLRFVKAAVWFMEGAPVNHGTRTIAAHTKVQSYFQPGLVQVLQDDWIETWVEASGDSAGPYIIWVQPVALGNGNQTFQVAVEKTTGNLVYKVGDPLGGFQGNFNVRLKISAGRQILHTEAESIGTPPP